ncbi:hypothetical protein PpBr36_06911 [Pyricularia pennisetigena]|uniref:hypothetical protein n=1 Tax=Pyricularia pennisetigena TaxID=1578925 RepID=UPI001153A54D|nr:hypothetical protein PpBr36_06911 [Pyricularia pennisetigena]TLS25620.1 hypothetical protein PpBr36_06911 [Pyricularia pennisetigena]
MEKRYTYSPLSSHRQIRLLRVFAGAGDDELSGELFHAALDSVPRFTALSYAWGDPQPQKTIRCCDSIAEVLPSLHSALRHLREPYRDVLVWADALCIDQENILERNEQVKIMGDIYASAMCTAIWLGEESTEVKMAFGWLRRFDKATELWDSSPQACKHDAEFIDRHHAEAILQSAFGNWKVLAFKNIWALLDRPWFTRKWIIQELVKSRMPLLVSGRNCIPWPFLSAWLRFIRKCTVQQEDFRSACPRPFEADSKVLGPCELRATLLWRIESKDNPLLLFLLTKTLQFRCHDPRDHVFALIGIASDAERFRLIDYRKKTEDVCRQLAYLCVSDTMNLKLLWSLLSSTPLGKRLHSWVPDLENGLAESDGGVLATQFCVQQERDYNAGGKLFPEPQLDRDRNLLKMVGRIVDKVQLLGSDNRSLINAQTVQGIIKMSSDLRTFGQNLQLLHQQKYQWLEECIAIAAKTISREDAEEAFKTALLSDKMINEEAPRSLELVRREFSTCMRLMKEEACGGQLWLLASSQRMSLESGHHLALARGCHEEKWHWKGKELPGPGSAVPSTAAKLVYSRIQAPVIQTHILAPSKGRRFRRRHANLAYCRRRRRNSKPRPADDSDHNANSQKPAEACGARPRRFPEKPLASLTDPQGGASLESASVYRPQRGCILYRSLQISAGHANKLGTITIQ